MNGKKICLNQRKIIKNHKLYALKNEDNNNDKQQVIITKMCLISVFTNELLRNKIDLVPLNTQRQ